MISFYNDYNEIGHPDIISEIVKLQDEKFIGYSEDVQCDLARKLLSEKLENKELHIHFLHSGTMANILGILFSTKRYESVISANTGHIINTENGAIEGTGLQIIQVQEENGKVTVKAVEDAIKRQKPEYASKPGVVYISNATELGTIYKKSELEALYECCKRNGLYLYMDGARIGTALMSEQADYDFKDLPKFTDIFTIGGNKNGCMFGEALIIVNKDLQHNYEKRLIKQKGALLAKGFLLGIQFRKMFEENLFFDNAKHAVNMAKRLSEIFISNGISLKYETESNLVFVELPLEVHEKISKKFVYDAVQDFNVNYLKCRFVTTWNTKLEEIEELGNILKDL